MHTVSIRPNEDAGAQIAFLIVGEMARRGDKGFIVGAASGVVFPVRALNAKDGDEPIMTPPAMFRDKLVKFLATAVREDGCIHGHPAEALGDLASDEVGYRITS